MVGENGVPETPDWHLEARDDTAYLMRSVANAARIIASIDRLERRIPPNVVLGEN